MNKIYCMGDLHGNTIPIHKLNQEVHLDETDIVILLGDVGLNYYLDPRDDKSKRNLSKYPCKFYCLRGNHEQRPSLIPGMYLATQAGGYMYKEDKFPNIYYFMDIPEEYNIGGYSILTLPGAYSVDKNYRLQNGWTWFPHEQLSEEEWYNFVCDRTNIHEYDIVLSHTCPLSWEPTDLFLDFIDQSKVDNNMEKWFQGLEYQIGYKLWLWGHFHKTRVYPLSVSSCGGQPVMLYNDAYLDLDDGMLKILKDEYIGESIYGFTS